MFHINVYWDRFDSLGFVSATFVRVVTLALAGHNFQHTSKHVVEILQCQCLRLDSSEYDDIQTRFIRRWLTRVLAEISRSWSLWKTDSISYLGNEGNQNMQKTVPERRPLSNMDQLQVELRIPFILQSRRYRRAKRKTTTDCLCAG